MDLFKMGTIRPKDLDNLVVAPKSSWPYTIPEEHKIDHPKPSSESRFNLEHGFLWGKIG